MNGKKIKASVIALALVLCANCAVGCEDDPAPLPDDAPVAAIAFAEKQKDLTVGDEVYVSPTYEKKDGFVLTYLSDNSSVATVDENGKICALLEGTAVISAIYSDGTTTDTATLTVNVSFNGNVPKLVLNHANVDGSLSLAVGSDYQLDAEVSFNSLTFSDVELEYSVEDPSVASVNERGVVEAKKVGETNVVIKGSWRGVDYTSKKTLLLTVPVTVKNDVLVLNDGKTISDVTLYTLALFDGETYATNMPNKFTATIDGTEYPATARIVNGDVAEKGNSVIKAKAYGTTQVIVTAEGNGVSVEKTFNLTVKRPVATVEGKIPDYCTFLGTWYDETDGGRKLLSEKVSFNGDIIEAHQGSSDLKVTGGKILGVGSSARNGKGIAEITVGTATALYNLTLETLDNVIAVKEDLAYLTQASSSGYWELLNDVDATGYVAQSVTSTSFSGVFDGKGHTIKNLTIAEGKGLFGSVGATTVIQNLGLDNLNATRAYYISADSPENGLTLSNIYVNVNSSTEQPRGLVNYAGSANTFTNILIEYTGANANTVPVYTGRDDMYGALVAGLPVTSPNTVDKVRTFDFDKNIDMSWKNVFVVSPFILSFNTSQVGDMKYDGSEETTSAVYAYGKDVEKDIFGNDVTSDGYQKSGKQTRPDGAIITGDFASQTTKEYYNVRFTQVANYADKAAMRAAALTYTLDETYWEVSQEGDLVWKSAKA